MLEKYYSELYAADGSLSRVSIITTNSCTNIKTYANLKYMNQIYIRDQFLMIRDGDGDDPARLKRQLCRYYEERNLEDMDKLPQVRPENVLILRYYSFENYFLNPGIMASLGIIESMRLPRTTPIGFRERLSTASSSLDMIFSMLSIIGIRSATSPSPKMSVLSKPT